MFQSNNLVAIGQQLLNTNWCMRWGSITNSQDQVHERNCFGHLKSYSDRDDYVFIDAEEVTDGHLHNFNKYDFQ